MKPAKFEYFAPTSLAEALELLEEHGDDAKVLAGGQSLMPMLNMRLARPKVVADINRIPGLDYISPTPDGGLAIGALTRQRSVEKSTVVKERIPVLAAAMPSIGHFQIRNRGTVGGSISHADPAAELPAVCLALDGEFVLSSASNQRVLKAENFFISPLTTAIEPGELLTEIRLPARSEEWRWGFQEVCRRQGDFAMVGAVSLLQLDGDGVCQSACITMFGVGGTPLRIRRAEEALLGNRIDGSVLEDVSKIVSEELDPDSDIHASATYRKEVGGVIARRTLEAAISRVNGDDRA
ncbi:MAG: xanthine dehydrogenase family protein subunit M [Chloroflexi bacterium]|nr:xanthine dehydrogenase family protein subunit M [Chloroflexota bacterium]